MKRKISYILFFLVFLNIFFFSLDVPFFSGYVNDYTNILDTDAVAMLEKKLSDFEKESSAQVVVLILESLEGDNLEEFSIRVVEKWKPGVKGKDNGALLLIAVNDRMLRIEVGLGLESSLTDLKCGQIIRNKITPFFKDALYKEGIIEGVDTIISVIRGADDLESEISDKRSTSVKGRNSIDSQIDDLDIFTRILIGLFIFGVIGLFTVIGVVTPGMGWFLYFFLIPFWAMFPIIVVGTKITFFIVVIYLTCFPLAKILFNHSLKKVKGLKKFQKRFIGGSLRSGISSGGFSSSHSSGFSSSSGSSSSSGGGGSFGGGGSSGSW